MIILVASAEGSGPTPLAAFDAALVEEVVRPGDPVLEIGAGSGILSLFACAAGPRRSLSPGRWSST